MMIHEIGVRKRAEDRSSAVRNCKSSDALCVLPDLSRRYTSWEVPWYFKVGTERTRKKKEGNGRPKSVYVFYSYHHRYLPDLLFLCGQRVHVHVHVPKERKEKKEEDCLSTSSTSSSSSINPFLHVYLAKPTTNKSYLQYFFFFPFPPQIFYEKIMQQDVRVIYNLHKDPSFFCAHKVRCRKSGSREVCTCTCYLLGKLRVRSGQSGRPGGTGGDRRPDVMRNLLRKKKFGLVWMVWSGLVRSGQVRHD